MTETVEVDTASTTSGARSIAPHFDPNLATLYGRFLQAAYTMYNNDPTNLTPPQSADFPAGYQLGAWVLMRDFIIWSTSPLFYGFIAHSIENPNQLVLAIRGTEGVIELWDDINAVLMRPFRVPNCGSVAIGFDRIYDTLELVPVPPLGIPAAARSLREIGGFSDQIATFVKRREALAPPEAAPSSIEVTGHSLGSALATLYVMENASGHKIPNPAICTFASPLVGDTAFVTAFNGLQLTSWRIVNEPDIVPKLPPEELGFQHVDTAQQFNSIGRVRSSLKCWHDLATYLSLIDTTLKPAAQCQLPNVLGLEAPTSAMRQPAAAPATITTLSVPAGSCTINININVPRTE